MRTAEPLEQRFLKYVEKSSGCWIWIGYRHDKGYGLLSCKINGKKRPVRAHRIAYELYKGPIPAGMKVLHSCDNPPCVKPDHLFLGSNRDNSEDMSKKGRTARKLRPVDVLEILEELGRNASAYLLAARFKVSPQTIYAISRRETWKHLV